MSEATELTYVRDHTITKTLTYDLKSEMGIKIEEWVVFNKLVNSNSRLNYIDDDFTQTGNLCYTNDNGEKLSTIHLQELFHLRGYDTILPVISLFSLRSNNSTM